uniref:Putative phenylalanine--tRNA ligase alpha subunit n=1 Tax=Lygus hesperus TaxID=30085 RepID=A0A0A9YLT0_LYGHE
MEIFGYSSHLQRWIEVGNSGMFRPEMLTPMGFPPNIRVIAWGLSLERPTMIKYGISNIRDLVGPRMQLQLIIDNPVLQYSGSYIVRCDLGVDGVDGKHVVEPPHIFITHSLQEAKQLCKQLYPKPVLCTYYSSSMDALEAYRSLVC